MAIPTKFIGLHSHSTFSTFDAIGTPADHIDFAISNGMNALALTDHGNMNGFAQQILHAEKLKKNGVDFKPIVGVESYFIPSLKAWKILKDSSKLPQEATQIKEQIDPEIGNELADHENELALKSKDNNDKEEDGGTIIENETESRNKFADPIKQRNHLVLLAKNNAGLDAIFKIVSASASEGYYIYPRVDFDILRRYAKGNVIALSACIAGYPARIIFDHQDQNTSWEEWKPNDFNASIINKKLDEAIAEFQEILGPENYYLEMQFNKLGCIDGNAILATNNGPMTFQDVVNTYEQNPTLVLSFDTATKTACYKKVLWGGLTKQKTKVLKITLADGKTLRLTPEHKLYTNHGWVEAQNLNQYNDICVLSVPNVENNHVKKHKISGVYKITNTVTGQFYIGSAIDTTRRKNSHFSMLSRNKHDNIFFQQSYNQYGKASFVFELLEEVREQNLFAREQFYLEQYFDCCKQCFNIAPLAESTLGKFMRPELLEACRLRGELNSGPNHPNFGVKRPESVGNKISQALKGKHLSPEHKASISRAHSGKLRPPCTQVTKNKIRESKMGDKNPMKGRCGKDHHGAVSVQQLDLQGNVIGVYDTLLEASKVTGISFKAISLCLHGKTKTSGGFKWKKA